MTMQSDWILGLLGGLMIGGAVALFLWGNGRITGASGLFGGLVDGTGRADRGERVAFLGGLVGVPALWAYNGEPSETGLTDSALLLVLAGLLVGAGTRLGNGCTSGHGVCGISRFSSRGIAASVVYILAGMATVAALRHGLGVL